MPESAKYFQCCYCTPWQNGGHGQRVPKSVGHYRVKIIADYILIFQCDKCTKTFRVTQLGGVLRWADMTHQERTAFKRFSSKESKQLDKTTRREL